ncbi:AfsR/SARP family transcriptional regulator [Streptomyces sp. bgisy154]|uniref:AfsR/SARP family transcriptional regulator n=1 Tax=Streptomyces sp. bgisy154 TaxID=3413794 RepID=UPI003D71A519
MNPVRYRILGTVQALRPDGTAVTVGGARLRALLTVLALRAGRTVPAGLLVAEVWAGDPPADAAGALQALVGRLRRALGADAVASVDGGYRLTADPDDVDLHRFERLTADGLLALADGDAPKAAATLDGALALWQGPALTGLPDSGPETARWEARRLDALRARHAAALALGHAEWSLPELTALCDAHPLDEPLQCLRLRALRDAGRSAEALAAYDGVRRLLADRLGADPGPELRTLHSQLLAPRAPTRPAAPAPARRPTAPEEPTAPGGTPTAAPGPASGAASASGASTVGSGGPVSGGVSGSPGASGAASGAASAPGGVASGAAAVSSGDPAPGPAPGASAGPDPLAGPAAPVRSGSSGSTEPSGSPDPAGAAAGPAPDAGRPRPGAQPPGNLRARLTSFVGREADIEDLREDLATARLVTLLGPGGAGKTRLSQEAAERFRDAAPDGVWLAELAPVDAPDAVPRAVLTAVGGRETLLHSAGAEEMRAVAERHDDPVERLVEHCGRRRMLLILDNCEHVVEAAARLAEELLARCPGLTLLATSREPLGVPGESLRPVEPLPQPVALRLLAERGATARPGFRVDADEETAAACAEICRRLDGLPLAIELAAARLRMLTPRQLADRLDDRFRLLTSGSRTVLPRQQTLRAVVDWSWDLLDDDERDVLTRLSVFAGGCDLAAAEAVCGPVALEALGSLVDKSLVAAAPTDEGEMRYRLLETVAEYAGERLDEAGRRADAERAHLTYYRELARTTDPLLRGRHQRAAIARFETEYENLRTALRRAVAARDEQEGLYLVHSLVWYWHTRDLRIESRTWSRAVMDLGPDPFAEPVRPAAPVTRRCTDTPPPLTGEELWEARRGLHLTHLAAMHTEMEAWQTPAAQDKLHTIAATYVPGLPQTCRAPGILWFFAVMLTGDMERLREIIDANVRTCRQTPGFDWELAFCLQLRANMLANRTEWVGDAARDADEALERFRSLGDTWGAAEALAARAEAHERRADYREAAADYEDAMAHAERLGARAQQSILAARLGSVLLEAGDDERGERILREVIDRTDATSEAMPAARLFLSGWLGITGRTAEAREQLRLLRQDFGIAHFVVFEAFLLGAEAWLDAVDGHSGKALETVRTALDRAGDTLAQAIAPQVRPLYLTVAAVALGGVDDGARAADAARCLGAAEALLTPEHVRSRLERVSLELAEGRVRSALGEQEYRRAYAEGGGLSYEEAAALV